MDAASAAALLDAAAEGRAAMRRGDDTAFEQLERQYAQMREAVYDHGYLVFWAGRYELAEQRFTDARRIAEGAGDWNVVARALAGSARVALNEDPAKAVGLLRKAMEVTPDLPNPEGRSSADHVLGVALLAKAGGEWPADEREQYEGTLGALSAGLSPKALELARAAGGAMELDQAVSFALRG